MRKLSAIESHFATDMMAARALLVRPQQLREAPAMIPTTEEPSSKDVRTWPRP